MVVTKQIIEIVARFRDKATAGVKKVTGALAAHNIAVKENVAALGGFNFSWLSVMFAGMALYRVFGGILKQQLELWGIMEGFSAMLTLVMLPVMEVLSEILWPILDLFMNLPDPIKAVIGSFIVLGAIVGAVLMVAGMFMLALFGLIPIIGSLGITIAGLISVLGIVVGAIAGAVVSTIILIKIWKNWEKMGWKLKAVLWFFLHWPMTIIAIMKNWGNITDWLSDKWKKITEVFKKVLTVIKKVFSYTPVGLMARGFGLLGGFQAGGIVPRTGPYMLHKGEEVTPAGATTFAPTITVYATVASDYDVRRLADELKKYWTEDYERVSMGRSI